MIFAPPELILQNALYVALGQISAQAKAANANIPNTQMAEMCARHMVCEMAQRSDLAVVFRMLVACGGPADMQSCEGMVAAALDRARAGAAA